MSTFFLELENRAGICYIIISDKLEQIATKAPRHKAERVTLWLIFIFGSLCLGGVNVLPQNAKK
jgi:hypothetical protein